MEEISKIALYTITLVLLTWSNLARSEVLYFIDAHSQVDHNIDLTEIAGLMQLAGIRKTILAARRKRKSEEIAAFASAHPELVIASVRTKGREYKENSRRYYRMLHRQVDSGLYHAMAEVLLYHAMKGDLADEVVVYPDDERVQAALEGAKKNHWPLVLHIEFASLGIGQRQKFFNGLEKFLDHHSDYPVALIHMGQLSAPNVKKLIERHGNIYFLTSHSNTVAVNRSNQPWINMFEGPALKQEWENLVVAHPDRFIFAIDNVWPEHWRNGYKEQVQIWREALGRIPASVAHAVAHGNAELLWRIKK